MNYKEKYNEWLNGNFLSKEDNVTLKNMTEEEIKENFSSDLTFGTAGIRGIMGLGTNRISKYTISRVTQGLSNYLNKKYSNPSVVIAYDTRKNSKEFAISTALILNNNGIKTYIYSDVASTPELSFAVIYLKCSAGIVITSSHNASIYNGYKVYNNLGSQIVYPEDVEILNEINNINDYSSIKEASFDNELYNELNEEIRNAFIEENLKVIINKNIIDKYSKEVKITYTSLHGTGMKIAPIIFNMLNVNVNYVQEQCIEDSDFTSAKEPNPEIVDNYDLAIKYAEIIGSDVIIASDPDSDRLGVMIKTDSEYELLNGNIVGMIFANYILENSNNLDNKYLVRSIVTSDMLDKIANNYNIKVKEVLTGCKNIAKIRNENKNNYLFGFEESLGYMFNININDKNCFSSIISLIEILSYLKSKNMSIYEYIISLYKKYGYYYEKTTSVVYSGVDGMQIMNNIMNNLRSNNLLNYVKIDYLNREDELKSNCIKYIVDDNTYIMIRPSGTEPKIKIYFISSNLPRKELIDKVNNLEIKIRNILE